MKKKSILALLLCLMMGCMASLTACVPDIGVPTPTQLVMGELSYNDTTKIVSWDKVTNASGYELKIGNGSYSSAGITASGNTMQYTMNEVTSDTYTVSVIAKGDGTIYSDSDAKTKQVSYTKDSGTTATVPTAPQGFTATAGDSQVILSWSAPLSNGGSAITGYQVSKDNGSTWMAASTNTGHTFTGLTNGTSYTFKVRAVNAIGNGAEVSDTATPTAAQSTPSAPQNFTATAGDGQVTLSWSAPLSNGGSAITGYQVSSNDGTDWTTASSNTGHTFTSLTNGTLYTFKVRAVNAIGNGTEATDTAIPVATIPTYTCEAEYVDAGNLIKIKVPGSWHHLTLSNLQFTGMVASNADGAFSIGQKTPSDFTNGVTPANGVKIGNYIYIGVLSAPYNGTVSGIVNVYDAVAESAGSRLGSDTFSGANTEVFGIPTSVNASFGNKLVFIPDLLPTTHSKYAEQQWEIALTNISAGNQVSKTIALSISDLVGSNIEIDLTGHLENVSATFNYSITPKAVTGVKNEGTAATGTGAITEIAVSNEKISLFALAETKYNSLVGMTGMNNAEAALITKLGTIRIDGKLIDTDEIIKIDLVKIYANDGSNVKNLSRTDISGTMIINITLQQISGGTEKTVLARISFSYTNPTSIPSGEDFSLWGDDLLAARLITDAVINSGDVELAYKKETLQFMNYWNLKNTRYGDRGYIGSSSTTKAESLLFMSDVRLSVGNEIIDHFIFDLVWYAENTREGYRLYDRELSFTGNIITNLYLLTPYDDCNAGQLNEITVSGQSTYKEYTQATYSSASSNAFETSLNDYRQIIDYLYSYSANYVKYDPSNITYYDNTNPYIPSPSL